MAVKYVFWDSDNTLVNTFGHHWRKNVETLKRHGLHLGEEWIERIYVNNGNQNWEWLTADLGLTLPKQQYLDEIDQWYFAHIDEIEIRDGVAEAIELFKQAGLPMAVVSNGRRKSVLAALNAKNLAPKFKFILCKEDYEGRKPDPAPYLAAKTRMQQIEGRTIAPEDCLVIEDDPKGVAAGLAAGMKVIDRPMGIDDTDAFLGQCRAYLA